MYKVSEVVCPVDVPDGYSVVGSTKYPKWSYVTCQGCNGQSTWGDSQCKEDGRRDELILPNCTVSCQNSEKPYRCKTSYHHGCEFRPDIDWERCGRSCGTPALCHRESGESDCQCGSYAQHGQCETEANIRDPVCPYTCSRRARITCGDPNLLFPHALASLQTTPHWLDLITFRCETGYLNMGDGSRVVCSRDGTFVLHYNIQTPHCVLRKKYGTFRFYPKPIRLQIIKSVPAESDMKCAAACRAETLCSYFFFENNSCNMCKYYKWLSGGTSMAGKSLWRKVFPTEYSRDFVSS